MLRCCNYKQDECTVMYNTINDDGKSIDMCVYYTELYVKYVALAL